MRTRFSDHVGGHVLKKTLGGALARLARGVDSSNSCSASSEVHVHQRHRGMMVFMNPHR